MSDPVKQNLTIYKGATFEKYIRWETSPLVYKPIVSITNGAPGIVEVPNHGMPEGWRFFFQSIQGMKELNLKGKVPKQSDYFIGSVIDANHITIVDTNTTDFKPYTSGGFIVYNTPKDLSSISGRLYIKDRIDGTLLLSLDSSVSGGITIDNSNKYILIKIAHTVTEDIVDWTRAVYDLELEDSATEKVFRPLYGAITVSKEVTV